MKKLFFLLFLTSLISHYSFAQQTVGLFHDSDEAFIGFLYRTQIRHIANIDA
jgi:hypothetical protein